MNSDGSQVARLTHPASGPDRFGAVSEYDGGPAWAPDARSVYFSRFTWKDETASIFSVRDDGTHLQRLTHPEPTDHGHCHGGPAPSPDASIVLYTDTRNCEHGTESSIAAVTPFGRATTVPATFSSLFDVDADPAWAPSGRMMAYSVLATMTDPFRSGIYVSPIDGSRTQAVVVRPNAEIETPAWSKDGNWLAFSMRGIWIVHPDGTGLRQITAGKGDTDPVWLPRAS